MINGIFFFLLSDDSYNIEFWILDDERGSSSILLELFIFKVVGCVWFSMLELVAKLVGESEGKEDEVR